MLNEELGFIQVYLFLVNEFPFLQIPAIYWWYRTSSHAAEVTAGYYNPTNQDGYSPVFEVLKKHSVTVKFICSGFQVPETDDPLADPDGLSWQVIDF